MSAAVRHRLCSLACLVFVLIGVGAPTAWAEGQKPPDELTALVVFTPSSLNHVPSQVAERRFVEALGFERLMVPAQAVENVLDQLRRRGLEARRDHRIEVARTPNDPLYGGQWAYSTIRAEGAWSRTVGNSSAVVAVLDTGINADHPDLLGATVPGWDFTSGGGGDPEPQDDDPLTHGTSVSGVVAARTDNATGVAGTCWRCRLMPLKVLDANGSGHSSVAAEAIVHATDHGADVINMSFGSYERDSVLEAAVEYAAQRDVVLVAAAGNHSTSTENYPSAFPQVIGVGASTPTDTAYSFSNHGKWVSVAAPGCTTTTTGTATYGSFCGTSASAPLVAGVAGLIRSVRPDLQADDVRELIQEGAVPVGGWVDHGRLDATNTVPVTPIAGNLYRALEPGRILDTRTTVGGHLGKLGHRDTLSLKVAGVGGVPASGVAAVVLNVTVTHPTNESYLTVFPSGTSRPVASNLNFVGGQTVPNLVTVKVGSGGSVDIFNFSGGTHVVVDVAGYYVAGGGGAMFKAVSPARLLDTRTGTGGFSQPVSGGSTIKLKVAGRGGVPRHGVVAVAINVTSVDATRDSYLTVYPASSSRPTASTVNFGRGDVIPNMAISKLGRDGKIAIYNFAGAVDVVVDVMGYFVLTERGASFTPLAPRRAVDTRVGTGGPRSPVGHRSTRRIDLTGIGGVPSTGVSSVVTNMTAVKPTATETYLAAYPTGTARPTVSNLNLRRGEIFPNLAVAMVGTGGTTEVYNHSGDTHLVVDLAGYYAGD